MDMHVGMLIGALIFSIITFLSNTAAHVPGQSIVRMVCLGIGMISIGGLLGRAAQLI